jgi:hypothetical protein
MTRTGRHGMKLFARKSRNRRARLGVGMVVLLGACMPAVATAAGLPDGRGYELVSPVQKNGVSPFGAVPSRDGGAVDFESYGAFAGATTASANLYQATRSSGGWQTAPQTPTPTKPIGALEQQVALFYSPDLAQTIFTTGQSYAAGDSDEGSLDLYQTTSGGAPAWLSQGSEGGTAPLQVTFDGATPDASHVVFSTTEPLTPDAQGLGEGDSPEPEYLYDRVATSGKTDLVNVNNSGELVSPEGATLGNGTHLTVGGPPAFEFLPAGVGGTTTNAISSDGSKIFFESGGGLYMRENNSNTVQITEKGHYEGASADGSLVFFSNDEELVGSIFAFKIVIKQLFEFNTTNHAIGPVPAMSAVGLSDGDLNVPQTTETEAASGEILTVTSTAGFKVGEDIQFEPGIPVYMTIESIPDSTHLVLTSHVQENYGPGTTIQGTARSAAISAVSNDGSHVYFVAGGVLAENENAQHQTALDSVPNLYSFDTNSGQTTFVATLAAKDVAGETETGPPGLTANPDTRRPAVPSADGSEFVFASAGNLTEQNPNEEFQEIYRYTVADGSLTCLSCTAEGVAPTGNASLGETAGGSYDPAGATTAISEDGSRVFFDTPDALVGADRNGSGDVYEWEGGVVSLISDGQSSGASTLSGTTPSGDDALFITEASLVGADIDGGVSDVYDARVGGGFAEAVAQSTPPCQGEGCRGASAAPPLFGAPDSATLKGNGNLTVKAGGKSHAAACRKGFVRKRVKGKSKCVRKKAKKAHAGARKSSRAAVVNDHRSL